MLKISLDILLDIKSKAFADISTLFAQVEMIKRDLKNLEPLKTKY